VVGAFIANNIIGPFFIHHIANQTLKHMKLYVEGAYGK